MKKTECDPIIKLDDVWKIYQIGAVEITALRGLNLTVKPGEFIVLMGPSGSGKSTAMNMIGCLDVPTRGNIYLCNQNIAHLEESELAQIRGKKIGFIFQKFNLINTLSAKENVMLPLIFQNIDEFERKKKAEFLLNLVGLGDRMNNKPTELSGGEQQRVAIARALSNDPDVILADEPTGNLDSKTGFIVMDFLEKLHKEKNTTIVLVTHDPRLTKYGDRVEQLMDGRIVKQIKNNIK